MGKPIAKSLLCVQKIDKIPARPKSSGRVISNDTMPTAKNTIHLEIKMANKKSQLTVLQSNATNDVKISDGNANVPTNVFRPFVSAFVMIFNRPAM